VSTTIDAHEGEARDAMSGRICLLAAAVMWSVSGVVTKGLDLGPLAIAFYRSFFAGIILLPWVGRRNWTVRPAMVPSALVFGAMIGLYIAAIKATTAANAIFLQCTATFWVVPLSAALLRERPDRRSLWGIAVASIGIVAIVMYGYVGRPGEGRGVAFGLASGIAYASVAVGLRGLRTLDPIWLSAFNNLGGALALGGWVIATTGRLPVPTAAQALVLLAFGTFQMAIPYALFARGLRTVGAPEAGLITLVEPVLNPLWVLLVHGERPAAATLVGGCLLLAGVLVRYWPARRDRAMINSR
jgi:drug/metabolite transporter (DMT)-like permease